MVARNYRPAAKTQCLLFHITLQVLTLALLYLVDRGLRVVVDATPVHSDQGREGPSVRVEQHL